MTQRLSVEQYQKLLKTEPRERKQRNNEEHQHQAAFFAILKNNEFRYPFLEFIFAVPNAAKRNKQTAGILIAEGLKAGVPDVVIPMARRGFHGAYIENKAGKNTLTASQIKYRDFLISETYYFKSCYSVDEQISTLEWYLGIDLRK